MTDTATADLLEFDLKELLLKLWRRKGLIIGTMVVLGTIALLTILQLTPRYTAEARVMIDIRESNVLNVEAVVSGLSGDIESIESEVQVIRSPDLVGKVVDELQLHLKPEFNADLRPPGLLAGLVEGVIPEGWIQAIKGDHEEELLSEEEQAARTRTRSIDSVMEALSVGPVGRSRVIRIGFESEDPRLAAKIANAIADRYIVSQLEAKFEATRRANEWLSARLDELRAQVNQSEEAVEDFRSQAGLISGSGESTLTGQEISELNAQLVLEKTKRAEAEARLGQLKRLVDQPDGIESATEVLQSTTIGRLKEQEAEVIRKVAELSDEYGEKHPRMVSARAELTDLQSKIRVEVGRVVEGLRNEVEVARTRERTMEQNLQRLRSDITQLNQADVKLRALEREAEANRALLETFLARAKETGTQESFQQADATMVAHAAVPELPSFPRKSLLLAVSLLLSGALGVALAFLVEQLDHGFRSGEQIEAATGHPSLALLPRLRGMPGMRKTPLRDMIDHPFSGYAEAIRSLYLAVMLTSTGKAPWRILVTSSLPGEGKTSTACCLAVAAQRMGHRPVIIDCDLRHPSVHSQLGVEASPGLVDLLTAGASEAVAPMQLQEVEGIAVLPAGSRKSDLAILGSPRLALLLDELASTYDVIVIDSPPLLAVSDAKLLSRLADRTIFLIRWAHTKREFALSGLKELRQAKAEIAGVALSMVDPKEHSLYGYGDAGYYHRSVRKYYST